MLVALLSVGLLNPLGVSLQRLYVRSHVLSAIASLTEADQDLFTGEFASVSWTCSATGNGSCANATSAGAGVDNIND